MTELTVVADDDELPDPGREKCDSCGGDMAWQDECVQCYGDDPYGYPKFCPSCDFCCGC